MNDEEKKEGLEIIEEDAFEPEISDEELEQFYEDNKDAIDLIGGLDMVCTGILGQYMAKTYLETKGRPIYIASETEESYRSKKAGAGL